MLQKVPWKELKTISGCKKAIVNICIVFVFLNNALPPSAHKLILVKTMIKNFTVFSRLLVLFKNIKLRHCYEWYLGASYFISETTFFQSQALSLFRPLLCPNLWNIWKTIEYFLWLTKRNRRTYGHWQLLRTSLVRPKTNICFKSLWSMMLGESKHPMYQNKNHLTLHVFLSRSFWECSSSSSWASCLESSLTQRGHFPFLTKTSFLRASIFRYINI